jgi:hypothetical protein
MPATTILLPISRDSVAEVELTGAFPSFFQPGVVKDPEHIQQLPSVAGKAVAKLCLCGADATLAADFGYTIMKPQGIILLGLVIGITRSLRKSCGQTKDQEREGKVFHGSDLIPTLADIQ